MIPPPIPATVNVEELYPDPPPPPGPIIKLPKFGIPSGILPKFNPYEATGAFFLVAGGFVIGCVCPTSCGKQIKYLNAILLLGVFSILT